MTWLYNTKEYNYKRERIYFKEKFKEKEKTRERIIVPSREKKSLFEIRKANSQ